MSSTRNIPHWTKTERKSSKEFFAERLKLLAMASEEILPIELPLMETAIKIFPKKRSKQAQFLGCMLEMLTTSSEAGHPAGEIPKYHMVDLARMWDLEDVFAKRAVVNGENWWPKS